MVMSFHILFSLARPRIFYRIFSRSLQMLMYLFLTQGEYVAPEKIENVFMRSKFVAQAFVEGDSLQVGLID